MGTMDTTARPPCYLVAGHGRSGTSLIAAMLRGAGVDMGSRLMGPGEANVRGHFEDLDFHELHVEALKAAGQPWDGFTLEPVVHVPESLLPAARELVESRRRAGQPWGWKEPRATLFLDFWRAFVPELRFLLLFRPPWEVIDSLFRRGDPIYQANPGLAIRVWANYNRAVIGFCDRFPDRCLLVESQAAAEYPGRFADALAAKFSHRIDPPADLYDPELLRHDTVAQDQALLAYAFPEAIRLYDELRARAALVHTPAGPIAEGTDWAFRYWVDCRSAEKRLKQARAEVDQLTASLRKAESQIAVLRAEAEASRVELEQIRAEIGEKESELGWTRDELAKAATERDDGQTELERVRGELDQATAEIVRLESLTVWNRCRAWLTRRAG
jgi:hypothetical protein